MIRILFIVMVLAACRARDGPTCDDQSLYDDDEGSIIKNLVEERIDWIFD